MNVTIRIERVGLEGQGVGYDPSGNIYFVPRALPGDLVEVSVEENARRYRDAEIVNVIEPSADRRESPCPYFQRCGGCDWLHWDYSAQLRGKDAMIAHVLTRSGFVPEAQPSILAAVQPEGYRNRIQVRQQGARVGFYARGSHTLVDVERCYVAHPKLNEGLAAVRAAPAPPVERKLELAVTRGGQVMTWENLPHGAGGFVQVNEAQNERLRLEVRSEIERVGGKRVFELFCGNGNLTTAFAENVENTLGVDSDAKSIEEASQLSLPNTVFQRERVEAGLIRRLPEGWSGAYDTLLLDPPRAGAGKLTPFLHPALRSVIYVSCSPVTFSQDIQSLKKEFRFTRLQAIDMFPHTRHVEFVATFERP